MMEQSNVIPIAAVVAVAIFLVREVLEAIRRYLTNARKREAVRRLVAAECERNRFAIGRTLQHVTDIEDGLKNGAVYSVEQGVRGVPRLVRKNARGDLVGSSPIDLVHTTILDKYLFETASLDKKLFALMETALDKLAEAKHVRESLIEFVAEDPGHLEGFVDHYAPKELRSALDHRRPISPVHG